MHEGRQLIGIFDSGVGGLSVLREVRRLLPWKPALPGRPGTRPLRAAPAGRRCAPSRQHHRYLLSQGAQLMVVACNTASAAALHYLRESFPVVPFVGMEPAVKPAAEHSQSKVVGVLATPATFQGALYASVVERFAQGVTVLQNTCPGLVEQIEAGNLDGSRTRAHPGGGPAAYASPGHRHSRAGLHSLSVCHTGHSGDRRAGSTGNRPRPGSGAPARRLWEQKAPNQSVSLSGSLSYLTSGEPARFASLLARLSHCPQTPSGVIWQGEEIYQA